MMVDLSTAPYDAREIANYLLDYADNREIALTQMGLLKLVYFCHGWYLFYRHKPLVRNEFEAWDNGPVVRVVREAFKGHGKSRITSRAMRFDLLTGNTFAINPDLRPDDQQFVQQIFEIYHGFSAWELSELTHEEGSPWDKLWNSQLVRARFGMRIRNDEILKHFSLKASENPV